MSSSDLMTVKEVAAYYRMTENGLRVQMSKRARWLPPVYRAGRAVRFKRDEVIAAIKPVEQ